MAVPRRAWVTVVADQETCLQALVFMKSLRRVMTSADIVVLVETSVPQHLQSLLWDTFDFVIYYARKHETFNNLSAIEEGKLFAWTLTMYECCIISDPSLLILKNCDDLFESKYLTLFTSSMDDSKKLDCSLMTIHPSYEIYKKITRFIAQSNNNGGKNLETIIKNITKEDILKLNPATYGKLTSLSKTSTNIIKTSKLWNSSDEKPWLHLFGTRSEKLTTLSTIWLTIFSEEVSPCLNKYEEIRQELIEKFMPGYKRVELKEGITKSYQNEIKNSIAIIGQSCRLPASNDVDEFWNLLTSGGDGISSIPLDRLPEHLTHDPRFTSIKAGFLKCPIDEFDAKFFGISPREAAYMDPQQRLMVEVAWEALEDAAINPQTLKGSNTGVFSGIWTHEYEHLLKENTTGRDFHHVILGNAFSATSARVSYFLGLNGPNVAAESGCSSSMVSLHLACDSLRKRETDLALVTGVNLLVHHFPHSEVPVIAKDGHCKTFDETADGFSRAEGVVVMVVKRLADALRDDDRIYSIVRGSALSNEGTTSSFGTPSKHCQEIAIKNALKVSKVKPKEVDYVEAHGTGTPIGDPIEFAAISAGYKGARELPLMVGSVKTNTGHTESAAGLAGLMKVNLAMKNQLIPPHRNLTVVNPNIDLESLPALIPTKNTLWSKNNERCRLAGVSSFGISGTNVHVIVQEPPVIPKFVLKSIEADRTHHLLTLSAKTENALKDLVDKYLIHLDKYPDLTCQDICYTSNVGRQHFKHRLAIVVKDLGDMKEKLNKSFSTEQSQNETTKKVFLFTGQGSQYSGMSKTLYETSPIFKQAFDRCNEILMKNVGISLLDVLWKQSESQVGNLDETHYSQTAIFCVEYGLLKLWESVGLKPDYVLGHSVGEFAASVAAGFMTLEEALELVSERSRLIHNLPTGGMLAVRTDAASVEAIIKTMYTIDPNEWLDIAVINSAHEIVVAGKQSALKKCADICVSKGIKTQRLAASHAFHSRDMAGILNEFGNVANRIKYTAPRCHYVSGSTGEVIREGDMNGEYWKNHARHTVDFTKGMKFLNEQSCNVFIEIGAHPILLALGMSSMSGLETQNVLWLPSIRRNEENWVTLLTALSKLYLNRIEIEWKGLHSCYDMKKVSLPHYPFQRQKYWIESKSEPLTKPLHPLLGRKLPLAVGNDHVFQNTWDLNDHSYLRDHDIANVVILPGAGFLEIILAAAKQVLNEESGKEIIVEDFVVEAPMELYDGKENKIQIVASQFEETESYMVRIFVYRNVNGYNDEKGWKQFSYAKVSLLEAFNENQQFVSQFQLAKSRCTEEKDTVLFYKKSVEVGINFGDSFKSVSKIWKGEKEIIAEIPCPKNAGGMKEFVYHPIILDAMLQTVGAYVDSDNTSLSLPVGIAYFAMVSKHDSSTFYAHAFGNQDNSNIVVCLYDDKANLLSVMKGLRIVKTSIGSFMNVINAQKNKLPGMFEMTWRYRDGPLHSRADMTGLDISNIPDINTPMQDFVKLNDEVIIINKYGDRICTYFILIAFSKMGWKPQTGDQFYTNGFMTNFLVHRSHYAFVNRLLCILGEDGYLDRSMKENDKWIVLKQLNPINVLAQELSSTVDQLKLTKISPLEVKVLTHCGEKLADVLQGESTGVNVLFGNEDPELNPLIIFTQGYAVKVANLRIKFYLQLIFNTVNLSGVIVRILEIGAGSGATSLEILNGLQKQGIPCRYTFTDISPHFFEEAKEKLKNFSGVEFKPLNIENDPKYQGFVPHSYDIIVAANVIHATEYLHSSLQNVRELLVPNGLLLLQEMVKPIRNIDLVYGLVDGYWRYKDFDIRQGHPCVSQSVWTKVLQETGFKSVINISSTDECVTNLVAEATDVNPVYSTHASLSTFNSTHINWLIFSGKDIALTEKIRMRIQISGDSVGIICDSSLNPVEIRDSFDSSFYFIDFANKQEIFDFMTRVNENFSVKGILILLPLDGVDQQDRICRTALYIAQHMASHQMQQKKILCVSRGAYLIGDQGIVNPIQSTVLGVVKSLKNECPDLHGQTLDLDPDEIDMDSDAACIFSEMWNTDTEFIVAYRQSKRFVMRITPLKSLLAPLILPNGRYEIVIPRSKKINDVSFISKPTQMLASNEIEISVKATALNFRDIFVILKPESFDSRFNAIGTDFSGIITRVGRNVLKYKIGDDVFGVANASCAASHVVLPTGLVLPKPKEFTYSEACTLPSVLLTAYFSLVKTADLKCGETILIHVASGGVGLVAIQIAQYIGAKIIATAGNKRKRTYLRSIGVEHVFHSRDLTFGEEIANVTNGKGVDMVLNSLTGQGFKETSLKACASNARFVEMGKVNIWQPEDVAKLRDDVKYSIVNLEAQIEGDELGDLMNGMEKLVKNGSIKPLPYTRFFISQIKDALNFFLKAQHIGKVVVTSPELKESLGKHFTNDLMFNENGTYLVTGGLGGIGLEVAKWMVKCGARNVVLVGRTAPDESTCKILKSLSTRGCRVMSRQVDVGDFHQCELLFSIIKSEMPPLRGVIHSAGALSDGILTNQTWEKFQTVFNAKVQGGWNLHILTKNLSLEYFILFSSMAAIMGTIAQSNHAAANMFLDSLAYYRHTLGLPVQTINWGAWSEIGAATNTAFGKEGQFGVKPFTPAQGIASLKFCMSQPILQMGVLQMDFNDFVQAFPALTNMVKELLVGDITTDIKSSAQADQFWKDVEKLTEEERTLYIKKVIENIIRQTLKLPESETIDEHQTFSDMGLDSLMAVEMRNKLQHIFGKNLTLNPTSLLDYPTLNTLSKFLAQLTMSLNIDGGLSEIEDVNVMDSFKLALQDSVLPDCISQTGEITLSSKIKNILLTGVTGHLAPYVLNELTNYTVKTHLFCLIRSNSFQEAEKRLETTLRKFNLHGSNSRKNVSIVLGDITEECFGMKKDDYEKLAKSVDAIFHCAVKANHIEKYKLSKSKKDIRSANVLGTIEILKFACAFKTKRVTYTSSYAAANVLGPDGCISNELPSNENKGEGLGQGYALTKFVGEKLMEQAIKRGIPCTVLRFPTLTGHSQTGHFTTDTNFIMNLLFAAARLKVFRAIPGGWYSMSVDVAAKISTRIFFNDDAELGLYNIVDSKPMTSEAIIKLAKEMGFTITMVDEKEFADKLSADPMMSIFREAYGTNDPTEMLIGGSTVFKFALKDKKQVFNTSPRLLAAIPDIENLIPYPLDSMRVQIQFAKDNGILDSLGIEYDKSV